MEFGNPVLNIAIFLAFVVVTLVVVIRVSRTTLSLAGPRGASRNRSASTVRSEPSRLPARSHHMAPPSPFSRMYSLLSRTVSGLS